MTNQKLASTAIQTYLMGVKPLRKTIMDFWATLVLIRSKPCAGRITQGATIMVPFSPCILKLISIINSLCFLC
jgi:hypothetical protein